MFSLRTRRYGPRVCDIFIHTLVLFTTSPRLAASMVTPHRGVKGTLHAFMCGEGTRPAAESSRLAATGCLVILLHHNMSGATTLQVTVTATATVTVALTVTVTVFVTVTVCDCVCL